MYSEESRKHVRRLRGTMAEIRSRLKRAASAENPVVREILEKKASRLISTLPVSEQKKLREERHTSGK